MIYKGDCIELITKIESKSIDLILVDPPYNISRKSNFNSYSENTSDKIATKYGNISIDFGDWDKQDLNLDLLFKDYFRMLFWSQIQFSCCLFI